MKFYYSLTEAAEILGLASGNTLKKQILYYKTTNGKKIGRNWVISYKELNRLQEKYAQK